MAIQLSTNCIEHHAFLLNYLASSYEKEEHLDVTFVCKGGKVVKAHQLVLASVSPFLRTVFNECTAPEVSISLAEIDDHLLTQLLTLMYEGTLKMLASDAQEFQELIEMLGIQFPGDMYVNLSPATLLTHTPQNGTEELASSSAMAILALEGVNEFIEKSTGLGGPNDDPLNIPDRYFAKPRASGIGQPTINPVQPKPQRTGRRGSASEKSLEAKPSSLKESQTGAAVPSKPTSTTNEGTSHQNTNGPVQSVAESSRPKTEPGRNKKRKIGAENAGKKLVRKKTRTKDTEANTT